MKRAKTGRPVIRRGGRRIEVYIKPMSVVDQIDRNCRKAKQCRQDYLLAVIVAGVLADGIKPCK